MTSTLPRITVVTPSYNQGQFIDETIDSVLSQRYPNLDFIVMDGGSTDGTLEILRKHDRHLTWISEADNGQAHAINKGMRLATGDVLAFLNSDDLYEPGALQAVGEHFAANSAAFWLTGNCRIIDGGGHDIRPAISIYKRFWLKLHSRNALLVLNYVSQPATFWRRSVTSRVGFLDETLHYTMDYDYWLRIFLHFPLFFLDRYLALFRIHDASKSGTTANAQFNEETTVARRYTRNILLNGLHAIHKVGAVGVYSRLLARSSKPELV